METFDRDSAAILKAIGSKVKFEEFFYSSSMFQIQKTNKLDRAYPQVKVDHLNEHSNAAASGVRPICGNYKLFAIVKVPASLVWKLFRNSSAETLSGILDAYSRFCTDILFL